MDRNILISNPSERMKDTIYTNHSDTTVTLNNKTNAQQIVLHHKYENRFKTEDDYLFPILALVLPFVTFLLGYLLNSWSRSITEKNRLKKNFDGWRRDIVGMNNPITAQSKIIKEQFDVLSSSDWTAIKPIKMPPILAYNLIGLNKYEFISALIEIVEISEEDTLEITEALYITIEKLKHYERFYSETIDIFCNQAELINKEFADKLISLHDEIENVMNSDDVETEIKLEFVEFGNRYGQLTEAQKPSNTLEYQLLYIQPLDEIINKYSGHNKLYLVFRVLTQLTVIIDRLQRERVEALKNLNVQYEEYIRIQDVMKVLAGRISQKQSK